MTRYLMGLIPDIFLIGPPFFLLGLAAGLRLSADYEGLHLMSKNARQLYDRLAPWLFLLVFLASAVGVWIGVAGIFANTRQDAQREADQAGRDSEQTVLLECFDEYAAASSQSTAAVREASAARDLATAKRDRALEKTSSRFSGLLSDVVTGQAAPEDVPPVVVALEALRAASAALTAANDAVAAAREDNPVPPAPSVFCSDNNNQEER